MPLQVTDAEWKILEVLWDRNPRTMAEITKALEPETGWTRHTVITLLKRMEEKGTVAVDETGPAKRYTPRVSRSEASTEQTRKFLTHVFRGNAALLVNQLVSDGELSDRDLEELMKLLKKKQKKREERKKKG